MRVADIQLIFEYNYWANQLILNTASRLSASQLRAPARLSHGSVYDTLVHGLSVEWTWRQRIAEGVSPMVSLEPAEFPSLESIRVRWHEEERAMREFIGGLTDDQLDRTVDYRRNSGPGHDVMWQLLVHVVNHGTQTRSEAAVGLTEQGESPGDIDLSLFLRQRQR